MADTLVFMFRPRSIIGSLWLGPWLRTVDMEVGRKKIEVSLPS